ASFWYTHRLLNDSEVAIEHARPRMPLGEIDQKRLQSGERVESFGEEQINRGVDAGLTNQLSAFQFSSQKQIIGALSRYGDANSLRIDISRPLPMRAFRNKVRRLNFQVWRSKDDLRRTVRICCEKGDIPCPDFRSIRHLSCRRVVHDFQLNADTACQL